MAVAVLEREIAARLPAGQLSGRVSVCNRHQNPVDQEDRPRELRASWPEREQFAPDDLVTIWIEIEDAELERATSLRQVMDIIGERAKARGLTPEKLDAILNDC